MDSIADIDFPAASKECANDAHALTYQFAINGEVYPVFPVRSGVEAWTRLCKAVGQHGQTGHTIGISMPQYQTNRMIIGEDFETVISAGWTGKSLKNNSQLNLNLSNLTKNGEITSSSVDAIRKVYFCLLYDCCIELKDSGVIVLE